MTGNRKVFLLIMAALLSVVVAVSIGLAYPTPVASPGLGADWECHRSAIVTTCRRISRAEPMVHHPHLHSADTQGNESRLTTHRAEDIEQVLRIV